MKPKVPGQRIGWLDSTRMPARIHRTIDGGRTTVCGYNVEAAGGWNPDGKGHWQVKADVPRKRSGQSAYCLTCFAHGGKSLPFVTEPPGQKLELETPQTQYRPDSLDAF